MTHTHTAARGRFNIQYSVFTSIEIKKKKVSLTFSLIVAH